VARRCRPNGNVIPLYSTVHRWWVPRKERLTIFTGTVSLLRSHRRRAPSYSGNRESRRTAVHVWDGERGPDLDLGDGRPGVVPVVG